MCAFANQGCDALSDMQKNPENLYHICIEGLGFLICSLDEENIYIYFFFGGGGGS